MYFYAVDRDHLNSKAKNRITRKKNSQIKEASKIYPFKKKKKSESLCFRIVSSTLYFKNYFNLMIVRVKG